MGENLHFKVTFDNKGKLLRGDKNYMLHLPPNIPVRNFWSVLVFDAANSLLIQNNQSWPSVHSRCRQLLVNSDGSIDIWFGPQAPQGKEQNWIQTVTGKDWYMVLNFYDLHESLVDAIWNPGGIEEIESNL